MATKPAAAEVPEKKKRERKPNPARAIATKFAEAAADEAACKARIAKLEIQLSEEQAEHEELLTLKNDAFTALKNFGHGEG